MATYKVIQDIEAEDKLIGPLSLRQFVYAGICALCLWLTFVVISNGLAIGAVLFLPPAAIFGFLAFPWGGDQPTEVWALAKVQFLVKPRKRIWNQSGVKELVTVTAPKKLEHIYSNGMTQSEVRSRLKALADTIDSRGWVIKNVPTNVYAATMRTQPTDSDRLLGVSAAPTQSAAPFTTADSEDVFDVRHNAVAQKFDSMITASEKAHRQDIINRMNAPEPPAAPQPTTPAPSTTDANYWFLNQPLQAGSNVPQDAVTFNTQVVAPGTPPTTLPVAAADPTADEEAFVKQLKANEPLLSPNMHGHLHVIQPLSAQGNATMPPPPPQPPAPPAIENAVWQPPIPDTPVQTVPVAAPQAMPNPVTPAPDAAILDLARNDDLNVATIAREAQKRKESPDEVVISLH